MAYTDEEHIRILIALLKENGIRDVIASPGSTNIPFVASVQSDHYFNVISEVDERNAAYMACGIAAEKGVPVVIVCTGATASRNYLPGITEAHYRHLPVMAITGTVHTGKIGQLYPQVLDRTIHPRDTYVKSIQIETISSEDDRWATVTAINDAIISMFANGGGPVHVNMVTNYSGCFDVAGLPAVRAMRFHDTISSDCPGFPAGRIAIFVGSHRPWSKRLSTAVENFCAKKNAVVIYDHTSNYQGDYGVLGALSLSQDMRKCPYSSPELLIHIGDVSGSYYELSPGRVWRVNRSGSVEDTFGTLTDIFQMDEAYFFEQYTEIGDSGQPFREEWKEYDSSLRESLPDLPFSNIWCASVLSSSIPSDSVMYFGILNSLRSWNFFCLPKGVYGFSNTGGFGIDGGLSSAIGGALSSPEKVHYCIVGDLAFFYNMNALGNRDVPPNLRILLVNNGRGVEFRNYNHIAFQFGESADKYIAAAEHFGSQSKELVRNYVDNLGFEYLVAASKEEFLAQKDLFLSNSRSRGIIFEVFTQCEAENAALKDIRSIQASIRGALRETAKQVLGQKGKRAIKRILNR